MEIAGHNRSASSSSLSSFDSCSDLLGLLNKSSHGLAQAEEWQQEGETSIERIPVIAGNVCLADAKHVKVSQNSSGCSVLNQDGGLVEGLQKQEGSLQTRDCECEETMRSVESPGLENLATELSAPTTADKHKPLEDGAFKKGAQISSLTCSPPADYNLSSSSVLLSKKDALLQEVGSSTMDLVSTMSKGLDSSDQKHSSRSKGDDDACDSKEHYHPVHFNALDPLASSVADITGVKTSKDKVASCDRVHREGHNHMPKFGTRGSSGLEADYDLQQLENSIKFFDLYHKTAPLSQPFRSMSARSSGLDLKGFERIDSTESYAQFLSPSVMRKDHKFASVSHKKLKSASVLPWLNYEESTRAYARHKGEKNEFQSVAHKKTSIIVLSENQGGETGSNDSLPDGGKEAPLTQPLYAKEESSRSMIDGEMFGKKQVKDLATSDSNDLASDELSRYLESLDVNETYMDAITDPPLSLDESESHAANSSNGGTCHPSCVGSLSSSTSELHILHSHCILSAKDIPFVVDSVEVFGAKQRRGGSSLWERMVGVKDHTVYCIKVVSGKHEWEVLRRYRDFMNFYQQLKRIFNGRNGAFLLSPSEEVENDSRKVFGSNSPNVVGARTFRIEKFLRSLLQAGPPFSTAAPLFWFLRPPQGAFEITGFEEHLMVQASTLQKSVDVQLGTVDPPHMQFSSSIIESSNREQSGAFTIGKTIKLVLTIHQNTSFKQVLNTQHHSCAGCYRHLEYEKGLIQGFAQAFGRGKPRFCEYTGHLFCSSCHLNEFAVLPGHVLWHWDFTPRRVSQLAKAYLDSIYDQPLLCVRTANPYLYQRVPCLRNVKETRIKISRVLSCMRCPSRARILQVMGSRRYLLESNDFFALRDLEDLSKGVFAVLPGLLTAVLKTLMLHVTKQCSVCQDTGEWCGAGILCEDPFCPIFPFNEGENVVNCKMCNAPFHKNCFAKCSSCPSCPKDWVDKKQKKVSGKE
eukprot:c23733_g1_i1 orf=725-3652(+)